MKRVHLPEEAKLGFRVWGVAIGLFLVACFLIWQFIPPPLPEKIRMATGPATGTYRLFGRALRHEFAQNKIDIHLVPTEGSGENIDLLLSGDVEIALVQSGDLGPEEAKKLLSICAVFYEPVFVFYRTALGEFGPGDMAGKRIAAGRPGSGTRSLVERLLGEFDIEDGDAAGTQFLDLGREKAVLALRRNEVDVAIFVTGPDVTWLGELFEDDNVSVRPMRRSAALTRHYRYLSELVIPEGLIDIGAGVPDKDITVIATTASLVMRPGAHDALVPLFIESCRDIVGGGTLLSPPRVFPSPHGVDAELDESAAHYFRYGPSFLARWLPLQVAHTVTRLTILLLPLLTLLYPLLKTAGPLYRWIIQRRVFRWYRVLRALEDRIDHAQTEEERNRIRERLKVVEREIWNTHVPARYGADLFQLRRHHQLTVDRLKE
ncbi:MAG: ABC transporter substrate-binding protein [Planctomycetota bacterium]|nr:ABC transporter substrate-binding protein [Planctomycetota bacterium]